MERSETPSPKNRRVPPANTQGAKIIRIEVMGRVKDYLNLQKHRPYAVGPVDVDKKHIYRNLLTPLARPGFYRAGSGSDMRFLPGTN